MPALLTAQSGYLCGCVLSAGTSRAATRQTADMPNATTMRPGIQLFAVRSLGKPGDGATPIAPWVNRKAANSQPTSSAHGLRLGFSGTLSSCQYRSQLL